MVRILFLHPDLGIGGAERLVVDAAVALKQKGHDVRFLTNHHDPKHSFKETTNGSFPVQVIGDWLPRSFFGRFCALCAYFRMLYAAFYASFYIVQREGIDVVFCDQISIVIPVLRFVRRQRPRVIFYCHFPDQLLSVGGGCIKRAYRAPLNWMEERTIGMADTTLVNSKFTLRMFRKTFTSLDTVPAILYPSLNTKSFDERSKEMRTDITAKFNIPQNAFVILNINRYERKKNHALALNAFKMLADALPAAEWKRCHLIIAGGYDRCVRENIEHYRELQRLCEKLDLQENVQLLRSPNDDEKYQLLHAAHCLVYTPHDEHFGIVPLEAMYMGKPVIALNSGGPTETIVNESTGFLCDQNLSSFADAILKLYHNDELRERMGEMGRKRVMQKFSFEAFADKLENIVLSVVQQS